MGGDYASGNFWIAPGAHRGSRLGLRRNRAAGRDLRARLVRWLPEMARASFGVAGILAPALCRRAVGEGGGSGTAAAYCGACSPVVNSCRRKTSLVARVVFPPDGRRACPSLAY